MSERKVCEHCGKEFFVRPSVADKYRFCGYGCRTAYAAETRNCAQCGKEFKAYKAKEGKGIYCSKSCARTAANLTAANPAYSRDIGGENNPMFGKGLFGKLNGMFGKKGKLSPHWKENNLKVISGYRVVNVPDDHPHPSFTRNGKKFLLEHRYVMEQNISRYLLPEEVVHHRNANRQDNRIENLTLFANQSEHLRIGHGAR